MATDTPAANDARTPPASARAWLAPAAAAVALLLLSEAIWLWQTWPVRELLQAATP